ncbi:MAG: DUF262 domain-containing protein [Rhodospirillales bacterium]|nr:DUF262 domain-containing protein [Rhodospirillales bacterium]
MAETVNLDALIPRQDFLSEETPENSAAGGRGQQAASATDLKRGESFFSTLRKPDFQRETAAWSPFMVKEFVKAFVEDELVPSVICWQSPSRLSFVIDGAHRLSAIIAWLTDDYGDGELSSRLYNYHIPEEQIKVARKTRDLIESEIGSYKSFQAETREPGTVPSVANRARSLAHANVPLLWVKGSDSIKAERAFFTINQSAVEIDPTELKILNARTKPNAIAARAIVRDAKGHKYWSSFSEDGRKSLETDAKEVYAALFKPPLQSPTGSEELPIAGHGYGTQTLPLIFELVNIANGITVSDTSKSKRKFTVAPQEKPDEQTTFQVISKAGRLCRRISSKHASSLGLHPAVYFYSSSGRHQPTSVLAMAQLMMDFESADRFADFTRVRHRFEEFLVDHKMYMNQLTVKHGSMTKGFLPIRDYYEFVLKKISDGHSDAKIEEALRDSDKYQTLVKEKPILTKKAKEFSQEAKQHKLLKSVLESAIRCNLCGARIDKKAMQLGHTIDKKDGGLAETDNSEWQHPYCNSTYKPFLESKKKQ